MILGTALGALGGLASATVSFRIGAFLSVSVKSAPGEPRIASGAARLVRLAGKFARHFAGSKSGSSALILRRLRGFGASAMTGFTGERLRTGPR